MNASKEPIRVAVVGGGCAALTTAFELTRPEHMGQYEVTVYQMGWRLGGKGASGRGIAGRVEEHGLHLWMGFYENAFRLMRECYAERNRILPDCRFASWSDAFKPAPDVGVAERGPDGWSFWMAHFPPAAGMPGDPESGGPFTLKEYLDHSVKLIGELLRSAGAMGPASKAGESQTGAQCGSAVREPERLATAINSFVRYGQLAAATAVVEGAELLSQAMDLLVPQMISFIAQPIELLIDAIAVSVRRELFFMVEEDAELRRVWEVIDLILAVVRGSVRCPMMLEHGFDAINQYDWREWLRMNGASDQALNSGFMRGIYNLVFAFENGDVTRPRLAAGVALRGAMRMFFTYRGSLFWRMSAGMGDVVFAPLYQVLQHRGVKFKFFHRLRHVRLSPDINGEAPYVRALEFDVQAKVKGGGEYQPLVDIHNLPSWPSQPIYAQLVGGRKVERNGDLESAWEESREFGLTLEVSRDFDFVVLGISVGALPEVARELIERAPRWRDMVQHVKTVPTQTFQLWMRETTADLGWPHPPANLAGFVEPFDTWAEMSHLIPEENWNQSVRSVAYFCSVLPDALSQGSAVTKEFESQQRETVRGNAIRFLQNDAGALWPNAVRGGDFRWELLAAKGNASARKGPARFETQYWKANVNPTDRYVLSLPGSIGYRISPLDITFDNLTIAGDWTASGLDSGCIESAIMSGMLAAHAISGKPALKEIVGYDHP
jgi:uncharacterized protein with NAD-binding domain and iron-sulfur cluster